MPYNARILANDVMEDLVNETADQHMQPFAVPAFELWRLLMLAREHGEPFKLRYTALPKEARFPGQWKQYKGPQVLVEEHPSIGVANCTTDGGRPCTPNDSLCWHRHQSGLQPCCCSIQ